MLLAELIALRKEVERLERKRGKRMSEQKVDHPNRDFTEDVAELRREFDRATLNLEGRAHEVVAILLFHLSHKEAELAAFREDFDEAAIQLGEKMIENSALRTEKERLQERNKNAVQVLDSDLHPSDRCAAALGELEGEESYE